MFRSLIKGCLGLICFFCASAAFATFQTGANALIKKLDPKAYIGIEVVDLTTGATLYTRNAQNPFIPASNMKLFSDAAALMVLGPDYRFTNRLSTHASQIQNGVLTGSLYLYLSGDPSFDAERLQRLLSTLQNWQIKRIQGNLVVDSTHARVSSAAPGWVKKDLAYTYGAPLSPVMVDANRLQVIVNPGAQEGSPAVIEVLDKSQTIQVKNTVITRLNGKNCGVGLRLDKNHQLLATGCIAKGSWAIQQGLSIQNPFLYLQGIVREALARMHIELEGDIVLGNTPKGSLLLASDSSKPISQLMADTLKPSDNLYADSLFLHAAAVLNGQPIDWEGAEPLIKQFLQNQTGINLNQAILIDGSGLSRFDRLSPAQTAQLLKFLYFKFPLSYEYISALPVSGRDGTLLKRLKNPNQQDFIRAKTGTMAGVSSLSGYIYTANGHTLAFSMYANRKPKVQPRLSGRQLIDALCTYFLKQEPTNLSWATFFSAHKRMSFQQHLTQAQIDNQHSARWRRLESAVKAALNGQSVGVVYRPHELRIVDRQSDPQQVYRRLQGVAKQYPFATALVSKDPIHLSDILWIDTLGSSSESEGRVWVIREGA